MTVAAFRVTLQVSERLINIKYMFKKLLILSVFVLLAGLALPAGWALAASGTTFVDVVSCESVAGGVRIGRGGAVYVLTNGVRDAGHGLRNYSLTCVSPTRYRVIWSDVAAPQTDTIAPNVSVSSNQTFYTDDQMVKVIPRATDNVAVTRLELFRDGVLVKAENNVGDFLYSVPANQLPLSRNITFFARAFDAAGHMTQSGSITIFVSPRVNADPTVSVFERLVLQGEVETVEITASAGDDRGLSAVEIYVGTGNVQYTQPLAKRCALGNSLSATCVFSFPKSILSSGFYWARAIDTSSVVKDTGLFFFSH